MAQSWNTLAGLIQLNDRNLADLEITDLLDDAPVIAAAPAVVASNGTQHKYLKQTGASSAAFRAALGGLVKTTSIDTLVTDTLQILDASFDTDVALADAYKGGRDAWLQIELARSLRQCFAVTETQLFYGAADPGSTAGFVGLRGDAQLNALARDMVVTAGGSNSDTQTSVYALRWGQNDCAMVVGNDGRFVVEEEPTIIQKTPDVAGAPTAHYPALYVPVTGYVGFQIGGAFSAGRLANVECNVTDSTTALTDDHLAELLSLFPAGRAPNMVAMNRTALRLLRQSRSAYSPTGAPAPFPTEVYGIPIMVTDGLVANEAVQA